MCLSLRADIDNFIDHGCKVNEKICTSIYGERSWESDNNSISVFFLSKRPLGFSKLIIKHPKERWHIPCLISLALSCIYYTLDLILTRFSIEIVVGSIHPWHLIVILYLPLGFLGDSGELINRIAMTAHKFFPPFDSFYPSLNWFCKPCLLILNADSVAI